MNKRDLRLQAKAEARAVRLAGSQRNDEHQNAPIQSVHWGPDPVLDGNRRLLDDETNEMHGQHPMQHGKERQYFRESSEIGVGNADDQNASNQLLTHSGDSFRQNVITNHPHMLSSNFEKLRGQNEQRRVNPGAFEETILTTSKKQADQQSLRKQLAKEKPRSIQDGFLFGSRRAEDEERRKCDYAAALEAQMAEFKLRKEALAESRESRAVFADESAARESERANARKAYAAALKMQMTDDKSRRRPLAESRENRAVFADEGAIRETERADARKAYASALREQMQEDARRKATQLCDTSAYHKARQAGRFAGEELKQDRTETQRQLREAASDDSDIRRQIYERGSMAIVRQPPSQYHEPQAIPSGHYDTGEKGGGVVHDLGSREGYWQRADYPAMHHVSPQSRVTEAMPSQQDSNSPLLQNGAAHLAVGTSQEKQYVPSSYGPPFSAMIPQASGQNFHVQHSPEHVRPLLHEKVENGMPSHPQNQLASKYFPSQRLGQGETAYFANAPPRQKTYFNAASNAREGFSLQESAVGQMNESEQRQRDAHTGAFPDGLQDAKNRKIESVRIAAELREQIRQKEERRRLQGEARRSNGTTPPGYRIGPTGQLVRLDPRDGVARLKVEAMAKIQSISTQNTREQSLNDKETVCETQLEVGTERDEEAVRKAKNDEYARQLQADMVAREERRQREEIERKKREALEESKLERERAELEAAYKRNEQPKPWMKIPVPLDTAEDTAEDRDDDHRRRRHEEEKEAIERQRLQDAADDARVERERAELAARLLAEPERPIDVSKASNGQYPVEFLSEENSPSLETPGITGTDGVRVSRPISADSRISVISSVVPPSHDFPESGNDSMKCFDETKTAPEPPPPPPTIIWEKSSVTTKGSPLPPESTTAFHKVDEPVFGVDVPCIIDDWHIPPSREAVYDYKTVELLPRAVANLQSALGMSSPLAMAGQSIVSHRPSSSSSGRGENQLVLPNGTADDTEVYKQARTSPVPSVDLAALSVKNKSRLENILELEHAADDAIAVGSTAEADAALERLVAAAINRPVTSDILNRPKTSDTEQSLPNAVRWATRQHGATSSRRSLLDRTRNNDDMPETPAKQWSSTGSLLDGGRIFSAHA